ncbi:MAG: hypothetical protein LBR16_05920 [Treponema sp.]|nr:hypothetical protein [Treponema sp.]
MTIPVVITSTNGDRYFRIESLSLESPVHAFECRIPEYAEYLKEDALRSQADHVAKTWLLREEASGKIAAYMSLVADDAARATARA